MDFEADAKIDVKDSDLKELSKLANKQVMLMLEITTIEQRLEQFKKALKLVSEVQIPELMQRIGITEFKTTNGAKVKIKPFYSGTIDDTNKLDAFDWLNKNGHGTLIKKELTFDFGRKDGIDWSFIVDKIKTLVKEVEGVDVEHSLKEGIHHKVLSAFIKEQVESGKEFPLELFKAYTGNKATITVD